MLALGALAAFAVVAGAGCGSGGGSGGSNDSGGPGAQGGDSGGTTAGDGAGARDGGSSGPDSGGGGDSGIAPDGGSSDAAVAPDAFFLGLSWPDAQVFPSFAPPSATLDVVNESALPADDAGVCEMCTTMATLEGLVNRTQPRIWLTHAPATDLWLSKLNVTSNVVADPLGLVTKYEAEIAGVVVYDPAVPDTLNLATTIAGVKGGIVSSPAIAATLTAAPYKLPVLDDLRTAKDGGAFTSNLDVYQYELDNYGALATHRLITGLELGIPDCIRDYAVATKAMMVWLDARDADQLALLNQFLALLKPNSPYLGWWPDEGSGVQAGSTYGAPTFAADWSTNLTVLGGTPRLPAPSTLSAPPPPPPLENKLYVAIFNSDGDNLQEDEGLLPSKWADSNRGNVPISWTIDPALVDVAPIILRYFQSTATVNDLLVSGPSGLGYTYPTAWTTSLFDSYTKVTAGYMAAAGLDIITVWNGGLGNGADLSTANAQSYATNIPGLLGMTIQQETVARQWVTNTLPLDLFMVTYGSPAVALEIGPPGPGITPAINSYNGSQPVFAAIQGDMNMGTINPTAYMDVQNYFSTNSNIVFVRGDHYFQLMTRAHNPPGHQLFTGDVNGDGKMDVIFYYGGNGDVWAGLSDGTNLNWSRASNLAPATYGNLLDGAHQLFTGDFNGDHETDVAFYSSSDNTVWLGTSSGTATVPAFTWTKISTTTLGNWLDGAHRVHVADYNGDGKADFSVYDNASGANGTIWLGISSGTALTWYSAAGVGGFGNLLDGSHQFVDGDFDGDGKEDMAFYYNGDGSVWVGKSSGTALTWGNYGSASAYGNVVDYNHQLMAGDFNGDGKTDIAFYSYSATASSNGVWFGLSSGTGLTWSSASNTASSGNLIDWYHRLYTADVNGDGKVDLVSYNAGTGAWNVGVSSGSAVTWSAGGSTASYGDLADYGHLLWLGDFDGSKGSSGGIQAPLFYSAADGNFWMGSSSGSGFSWHLAGNTTGFGNLAQ